MGKAARHLLRPMARRAVLAALGAALSGCANAGQPGPQAGAAPAALLSEDEATDKAIAYLKNTDYGGSRLDVIGAIKAKTLLQGGHNACGTIAGPVWVFDVEARFKGTLYLDAATGQKQCSTLPFLR